MKLYYIIVFTILFSCVQKPKEQTETPKSKADIAIEGLEKAVKDTTNYNVIFKNIIENAVIKSQPIIDTTDFDNFTATKYLNKKEVTTLKLEEIYPDFYKETHNFKAVPSYKIEISKDFYSLVVVILKGENEMESILINYGENRNIIDYRIIAYDEIAEGMSKIESKIEQNKVTIDNIFWSEEKQVTTEVFEIDEVGKIKPISTTTSLDVIDNVIAKLGLDRSKIYESFTSSQILTDDENEYIVVVIPEIAEEEEEMLNLNSHIVLVNTATGKITHKYFEANAWQSDAISIEEIAIDTITYQLSENTQAFGLKTFYLSRSQPNPYNNRTITLFVKSGDSLKKVLNSYDVSEYGGEWDTRCAGEFTSVDNTFKTTNEKNNNYFDIEVKSKITKTNSYVDEKGECTDEKTITIKTSVLKFDGNMYKPIKE